MENSEDPAYAELPRKEESVVLPPVVPPWLKNKAYAEAEKKKKKELENLEKSIGMSVVK